MHTTYVRKYTLSSLESACLMGTLMSTESPSSLYSGFFPSEDAVSEANKA